MLKTIYLIHHSHTDIGYTHPQPTVRHLHVQHIDEALREIGATRDLPPEARMRWTCETLLPVFDWWKQASRSERKTFLDYEQEDLIEVTGMWTIGTQCSPPRAWEWMMEQVERARSEMGVRVRSAMLSDINGAPWATPDHLTQHGIKNFSMGINEYFGKSNLPRLYPFRWRGPQGGSLNVFNSFHYNNNQYFGIPYSLDATVEGLARLESYLADRGDFNLDFVLFQVTRPDFNDNNGPDSRLPRFVAEWNARGLQPVMKLVTLSGFFESIGTDLFEARPLHSGEWTDFWNIGAASTPFETALNRQTYRNLQVVESLLPAVDGNAEIHDLVAESMELAVNYDEHTWGSDYPVAEPFCYATRAGRHFKNAFAFGAHDAALRAQAEVLINLIRKKGRGDASPHLLVANPHAWTARKTLEVPASMLVQDVCPTSAHIHRLQYTPLTLPPVSTPEVPLPLPEGTTTSDTLRLELELEPREVRCLSREDVFAIAAPLHPVNTLIPPQEASIENSRFRLSLDPATGGLASWRCLKSGREFLQAGPYAQGVPLRERPRGGTREELYAWPDWTQFLAPKGFITSWDAVREPATLQSKCRVIVENQRSTLGLDYTHPGCRSASVNWTLDDARPGLTIEVVLDFQREISPEAWYWPLQFAVDSSAFEYDSSGNTIRLGTDQIPNSNTDFFTVHRWIRIGQGDTSMLVFPLDTPLAMLGGLNFGRLTTAETTRLPLFAGVLQTNYWITNYAASCDGEVKFRFYVVPGHLAPTAEAANVLADELSIPALMVPFVPSAENQATNAPDHS